MSKKLKVAVTGGIGSGKSLFSGYLEKRGFTVLKADDISKEILSSDKIIRNKIIQAFGSESFIEDKPNKKFLADKVFSSIENVIKINSILHPAVLKQLEKKMGESADLIIFVEAALVYEADMEKMFDYVVLITADEKLKLERKTSNDNFTPEDFERRSLNQIPDEEKKKRADFIFENNGTKADLKLKADLLIVLLKDLK